MILLDFTPSQRMWETTNAYEISSNNRTLRTTHMTGTRTNTVSAVSPTSVHNSLDTCILGLHPTAESISLLVRQRPLTTHGLLVLLRVLFGASINSCSHIL